MLKMSSREDDMQMEILNKWVERHNKMLPNRARGFTQHEYNVNQTLWPLVTWSQHNWSPVGFLSVFRVGQDTKCGNIFRKNGVLLSTGVESLQNVSQRVLNCEKCLTAVRIRGETRGKYTVWGERVRWTGACRCSENNRKSVSLTHLQRQSLWRKMRYLSYFFSESYI